MEKIFVVTCFGENRGEYEDYSNRSIVVKLFRDKESAQRYCKSFRALEDAYTKFYSGDDGYYESEKRALKPDHCHEQDISDDRIRNNPEYYSSWWIDGYERSEHEYDSEAQEWLSTDVRVWCDIFDGYNYESQFVDFTFGIEWRLNNGRNRKEVHNTWIDPGY